MGVRGRGTRPQAGNAHGNLLIMDRPRRELPCFPHSCPHKAHTLHTYSCRTAYILFLLSIFLAPTSAATVSLSDSNTLPELNKIMAGYFSNHSQSRFLANSSNGAQNTSSSTTTTVTAQSVPRPRVPSSKHFSTSVSTSSSGDEKPSSKEKAGVYAASNGTTAVTVHPLRNTCVL